MEVTVPLECIEKGRDSRGVSVGPRRLRQQVVDDVKAARSEQPKRAIQVIELAGPCVGEDEVKPAVAKAGEKGRTIGDVKADSRVVSEVAASDVNHRPVVVDRVKR